MTHKFSINKKIFLAVILASLLVSGCSLKNSAVNSKQTAARPKVLNIYNWEDYLGANTIKDFEQEYGIKVNLSTFTDEEEMFSEIQSYPDKYDLVVASDLLKDMIEGKLVRPLDKKNIPNLANIDPKFLNTPYDPTGAYSVPYTWGTTGMVINTEFIPAGEDSWGVLFDPKYKGKIAMLNSREEVAKAALKYLGYAINTADKADYDRVRDRLLEQKKIISGYLDVMEIKNQLINGQLWAAQEYSGDGLTAEEANADLRYIIPAEGGGIWLDSFAITVGSPNYANAELFIDYVLRPKVNAAIMNEIWYASANKAAAEFTNPEILTNASIYPPTATLDKLEYFQATAETSPYLNEIWAELNR